MPVKAFFEHLVSKKHVLVDTLSRIEEKNGKLSFHVKLITPTNFRRTAEMANLLQAASKHASIELQSASDPYLMCRVTALKNGKHVTDAHEFLITKLH